MSVYELVVGLETHVQLLTASKMFCGCSAEYNGAEPNSRVCPVCLGLPGTLPMPNERAVELAVQTGLALGCRITTHAHFDRKNYHYPDLPKGYQISQHSAPLGTDGALEFDDGAGSFRTVGIQQVHLEEDTAKLTHGEDGTLADFNRAGVPLVEIVTHPQLRSPSEASAYMETLRRALTWIGATTGDMSAGALRVDVNVSVRHRDQAELGVKVEVKNLNSLAAVRSALAYEHDRLIALLESGGTVRQETRGWDEGQGRTVGQRSKEYAHDYRYFPEPNLPPLALDPSWVDELRTTLPELPTERQKRFMAELSLDHEAARLLARDRPTAQYVEACLAIYDGPAANLAGWITGQLFGLINAARIDTTAALARVPPNNLAELLSLIDAERLTPSAAKAVLARMFEDGSTAPAVIEREGLAQVTSGSALASIVAEVLEANPKAVADYRRSKPTAIGFLVGGVMRATRGQADAQEVRLLLEQALESQDQEP